MASCSGAINEIWADTKSTKMRGSPFPIPHITLVYPGLLEYKTFDWRTAAHGAVCEIWVYSGTTEHTENTEGFQVGHRSSSLILAFALLAVVAALQGCSRRDAAATVQGGSFSAMGTFAYVALAAADAGRVDEAGAIAARELARVEEACSVFRPGSDLARLNAAAGADAVVLSSEAETALLKAQFFGGISGGAFDITVGPLMRLWGFRGGGQPAEPSPESLAAVLEDVGWRNLLLTNGTARLLRPGASADLGGIAKLWRGPGLRGVSEGGQATRW